MSWSITGMLRWPALRRAVAAVCAVTFLMVGFAHALQHFDTNIMAPAYQTSAGSLDESPEPAKKSSIVVEHCHGCGMIAVPAVAPAVPPIPIAVEHVPGSADYVRPYSPLAETPPPILSI